jgi:Flp pilus assembly protein TadG
LRAALNRIRHLAGAEPLDDDAPRRKTLAEAGQIIAVFTLMLTVLIGLIGIAIDTTFAWREALRIQRASDAAALAGVVYMPGDFQGAADAARAEAQMNGFPPGPTTTITASPVSANPRELDVSITAQVPTFFSKIFDINSFSVSRTSKAVYVTPVAMGSPLAYDGVGCFVLKSGTPPPCDASGTGPSGVTATGLGTGAGALNSLGSWLTMTTPGGNSSNGDAYTPTNDSAGVGGANSQARTTGYEYTVSLPAGGSISLFDPGFCAMGTPSSGGGGNLGAGDHWVGSAGSSSPVSTYYTLWDTHNQLINSTVWTKVPGTYTGTTFENEFGYDSSNGGSPGAGATPNTGGCTAALGHDAWWAWPSAQSLAAGTYEVQVQMTNPANPSINAATNAQNMFAIEASGLSSTVFGQSTMCVYNNLADPSGTSAQKFYLADVDRPTGAGKTLEIDLFDVGDVSGSGTLKIWSPDGPGASQTLATFNYTTDNHWHVTAAHNGDAGVGPQTGTSVTSIPTAASGLTSNFNDTWIHILIPLPTSYGSGGLWQGGWWQIEYDLSGGGASDVTTWAVNVIGNPVHLI